MSNKIRETVKATLEIIADTVQELAKKVSQQVREDKTSYPNEYPQWIKALERLALMLQKFFRGDETIEEVYQEGEPEKYDDDPEALDMFIQDYLADKARLQQSQSGTPLATSY